MKTEMKLIAAILAVLAVALGGVYVLDMAQAETVSLVAGENSVELEVGDVATFSLENPPAGGEWYFSGEDYATWNVDTLTLTATAVGAATVKYMQPSGVDDPLFTDYAICAVTIVAATDPDEPEEPVELSADGAIWPMPVYDEDEEEREFAQWTSDADWQESGDYVYWIDGEYVTILDYTVVDIYDRDETYRIKAILPEGQSLEDIDPLDVHVEIEFYNFRSTEYRVQCTTITPRALDLANSDTMDADVGTIYLTGLKILLQGGVVPVNGEYKSFSLPITVPVMMKKVNISEEYEYTYVYNGLYQSPIKDLNNDNSAADDQYYEGDNPVPYINLNDCFEYPDISDILPVGYEFSWVIDADSTVSAVYTNKFEGMKALSECEVDDDGNYIDEDGNIVTLEDLIVPYVITIVPADDTFVIGKITITWWIVPLGLSDITFDIRDPYYDYDNEVRPKVIMKWYEPEDGPNAAKVHYILPEKVDMEYIMPEDYPYDMPETLVPAYKQAVDPETGEPIYENAVDEKGNPIMEQAVDPETGEPIYENAVDPETGEPIYVKVYQLVVDPETGDPVEEQGVDVDGNLMFRHWRYEDGTFAYYQLIGEDGTYVYETDDEGNFILDVNGNKIPVYDVPVYDEDGNLISEGNPVMVPVMVPVYELVDSTEVVQVPKMVPVQIPVYELDENNDPIPLEEQVIDIFGHPMYSEFEYTEKLYEDGSIVYQQLTNNKGVPQYNQDGTPKYTNKPVMVVKLDSDGAPVYDVESDPVMKPVYNKVVADFTATQVGYPYDDWTFDYGIHIVADTGFYEFDTDDYVQAVDEDGNKVFAQYIDEEGDRSWYYDDNDQIIPQPDYNKPLFTYGYVLVDDERDPEAYLAYDGEIYDPERFIWHILPVPVKSSWVDFEEETIIVPAEATQYWNYLDEEGNLINEPSEDYFILPLPYDAPTAIPAGQYYTDGYGPITTIEFPEGANFVGEFTIKNIAMGGMLNVDEVTVVDTLDEMDVDAIKHAVHLFAMNLSLLKPFTVDDFNVTVLDGDGDLIVFQDRIVRASLDSDMYAIVVEGNIENGYYGQIFGFFKIERESTEQDVSVFETKAVSGGVSITKYTGDASDVVIPDYIDGKKVVSIGEKAFLNNKTIESVIIGDNVKTIGIKAFYGCSKLKSVEFSDSVKTIKTYAFVGCNKLENVAFGHGLKTVEKHAFSNSIRFLAMGIDFKRGMSELPPNMEISKDGIYVYGDYAGNDGNTVYLPELLAGNNFVLGEKKGVLEFIHFEYSIGEPSSPENIFFGKRN